MGFDSPVHWVIVIGVIALLFGGSRVGNVMGEIGKGIKSFKQNLADQDPAKTAPPAVQTRIADAPPPDPVVRQGEAVHGADSTRL